MSFTNVKFGELFKFLPKSKLQASKGSEIGQYKFFTSSPIQKKWINTATFDGESLIFGTGGSASIQYVNEKFSTTTDCFVAELVKTDAVSIKYVYHFLLSNLHLLEAGFKGAGLKHISKKYIEDLIIPLPSIDHQLRIVETIGKAIKIKLMREESLSIFSKLNSSIFFEKFGDPIANQKNFQLSSLENLCELIQIGPFGTQLHEEDYVDGGIPLINPTHIKNNLIKANSAFSITPAKHVSLPQYHLQEDDLIMGRRGEMGRCAIVSKNEAGWLCGTGSLFLRLNKKKVNPVYLHGVITSNSMRKHLERVAQGVTMANLNKAIVGNLQIPLPSIDMQNAYSKQLGLIDNSLVASKNQYEAIGELLSSVRHEAFSMEGDA